MNTKSLLMLVCLLGFSSLAFGALDITFEQVGPNGIIKSSDSNRLLAKNDYACTFILYSKENVQTNGGKLAFLNIYGPPYEGDVENLDSLRNDPSYFHNLHRIVYQGAKCDCTVTVYQETEGKGKAKEFYTTTEIASSEENKIDLDWCWSKKAESLSITCSA